MQYNKTSTEHGIQKTRKFTDILCALLFLASLILLTIIAIHGYTKGDLNNIAQPFDSSSNKCGEGKFSSHKHLYINNPTQILNTSFSVCVKKCPKSEDDLINCIPNKFITNCNQLKIYKSYGFMGRICIPSAKELMRNVKDKVNVSYLNEVMEDVQNAWPSYLVSLIVVLVVAAVFYFLLQYCAGVVVWIMIFGAILAGVFFGVFCWFRYKEIRDDRESIDSAGKFKNLAIFSWVFSGVFFLITLCLCSQINLAVKMIKAAASFINDRKFVFLVPLIHTLLMAIFVCFWIISFLYVFSVGEVRHDKGEYFGDMIWDQKTKAYVWLFLFIGIWCFSFTLSSNIFIISCLATSWYFDPKKHGISIPRAFCWSYTYHIGSIAFGSLILSIIWTIQLLLTYIYNKSKNISKDNFCFKCMICFTACFERLINYINRHSYIEIAIRNINFCSAVKKNISLFTGNFIRFGALAGLVGLFLVLGSILITVIVMIVGFYVLKGIGNLNNEEYETIGPIIVIGFIAFFVTVFFNYVFSVSADAMLHCFMYEEECCEGKGNASDEIRRAAKIVGAGNVMMD